MVERIEDMPAGVVGLRASGKLTRDDYRDVLEPGLKEAMDSGEARVVFVIADYDGIEPGAAIEDIKTGLGVQLSHREAWKRLAVVTDIDWMAKAMHAFAWAMPGELAVYGMDELEEAKSWVAG
jgi:SpoIIAA-like